MALENSKRVAKNKGAANEMREVFYELIDEAYGLIRWQNRCLNQAFNGKDVASERLALYDEFFPEINELLVELGHFIELKQAGGRALHWTTELAYDTLEKYYIDTGKHYQAKELVKAVESQLSPEELAVDANGNEPLSIRRAGEIIRSFKKQNQKNRTP